VIDIFGPLTVAATVWFARPDALKGSLLETLLQVRPTTLFGVPRVWEKIAGRLQGQINEAALPRRMLASWAIDVGARGARAKRAE
jgi:long-chain-fatty-acid--CoA ligase ACSBG